MSNNMDKIVKLACKPKNAPPKAKYVDVLVSATYSDDGSLNDIIRSLSLRLREPNAVVVFKALLTLHQMIRSGSTDNLLELLSQGDTLRLRNVSGQNWEGYSPPASMGAYANYLNARIRAWADLKHDLVRVQSESNRRSDGLGAGSKARRLRHLPVEKGLLREVKQVQTVLHVLVQCKFYDDDLRDENTVLAFRMLIKDLLVLFQAGNEGVCNILEHYFEMTKTDATEAFDIYKSFIKQTDKVVDYLGVVRKLHNVVNVPVPNLKHAPTSLVKALEEYLNDPNFEANRREYKASLGVVEGKGTQRTPSPNPAPKQEESKASTSTSTSAAPASTPAPAAAPVAPPGASQKIQDFFDSIQADHQPTMFGGPAQPFTPQMQMQMQPQFNPFRQSMMMPQQTGFMQPQMTGFGMPPQNQQHPFQQQSQPFQQPTQPFSVQQPQPVNAQQNQPPFMQPQMTGQMAFGSMSNRNSMFPQNTGMGAFGQQSGPFGQQNSTPAMLQPQATGSNPFRQSIMPNAFSQPASPVGGGPAQIQRPGSTPAFSQDAKPLTAQPTGSRNPFAPPVGAQPKAQPSQPKGPSMNELVWNKQQQQFAGFNAQSSGPSTSNTSASSPWGAQNSGTTSPMKPNGTGIGDVASSFAFDGSKNTSATSSNNDFLSQFGSMSVGNSQNTGSTSAFGSLSSNPTGQMSPTKTGSSGGFLQPQPTGFGGSNVKRFQPTSSFGSQLMETLPPIAEPSSSNAASPAAGAQAQSSSFPFSLGQQPQQQQQQQQASQQQPQQQQASQQQQQSMGGMAPQATGMPNPFRQSTLGFGGQGQSGQSGPNAFGSIASGGAFGSTSPFAGQNARTGQPGQQQPFQTGGQGGMEGTNQFGQFGQFGQQMNQMGGQQPQGGSLI